MEIALIAAILLAGLAAMRFADEPANLPVTAPSEETVAHTGFDPAQADDEPPPVEDPGPPPEEEVPTRDAEPAPTAEGEPEPTTEVEPEPAPEPTKAEETGPTREAWQRAWDKVKPEEPAPTEKPAEDRLTVQEQLDINFAQTVRAQQAMLAARAAKPPQPPEPAAPAPGAARRLSFDAVIERVVPKDMDPDETITAQQFRDGMNQVAAEVAGTVADEVQHNLSGQLGNERANEAFRNTLNSELDSYDGLTDRGRPMLRSLVFESVNRALRPDDRENAKKIGETAKTAIRDLCLEAGWFHGEPAGGRKKPAGTAGVLAVNAAGATVQKPEDVDLLNPTEVARAIR